MKQVSTDGVVTIKKYANRRLYNTADSSYVTFSHLSSMVHDGVLFKVIDASSGEDVTRHVLIHVVIEQEGLGAPMLSVAFLRQLVSMYGEVVQPLVPGYLEASMDSLRLHLDASRSARASSDITPTDGRPAGATADVATFDTTVRSRTSDSIHGGVSRQSTATQRAVLRNRIRRLQARLEAFR